VYDVPTDRWERITSLPDACGSVACVVLGGLLHGIGGAIGDTSEAKRSVDRHLVYDPKADRWEQCAPLPTCASAPSRCVPFIRSHASRALWYPASWLEPPLAR
jgi:hypothetical protein